MALFAHCFTCSKDVVAASRISRGLVERGYGVLRFDFTGLGGSDGEFANTSFTSNVDDLVAAAAALEERHAAPAAAGRAQPRRGGGDRRRVAACPP